MLFNALTQKSLLVALYCESPARNKGSSVVMLGVSYLVWSWPSSYS